MKYKKGQKVKCINPTCLFVQDKIYEITRDDDVIWVMNDFHEANYNPDENRFELVEESMKYSEAQEVMVKFFNLKVGDTIKILREADDRENGWGLDWHWKMDDDIGKEFKILKISPTMGINYKNQYWAPFFVVQKIKDAPVSVEIKLSDNYTAVISEGVTTVGCQVIPFDVLEKVYLAAKEQV